MQNDGASTQRAALSADALDLPLSPADASADLVDRESVEPVVEGRWPWQATLAFVIVACGLFWGAVVFAARLLFR